jgi:hypothetical protein
MCKTLGLFIFFIAINSSLAQVLNLEWKDFQLTDPDFEKNYIEKNKIKSIKIIFQTKPINERIQTKNEIVKIFYNTNGLPDKSIYVTNINTPKPDTVYTFYIYNSQQYIRVIRKKIAGNFISEYFEFNPSGYLVKYSKVKEQNKGLSDLLFKPGYQEIQWTESYKYEFFGKDSYKRICINDVGQPYKQQVFKLYNNQLSAVYTTFDITSTNIEEELKYNNKNQLIEKFYFSNAGNYLTEKYLFEFKNDAIEKELFYLNNKQVYENFYFYSPSGLLESEIKKFSDGNMDIKKYEYEFY